MKRILCSIILCSWAFLLVGQIKTGANIQIGLGALHSSNLQNNLSSQASLDPEIQKWEVNYQPGFQYGIGLYVSYHYSAKLSTRLYPTINHLSHKIKINYQESDVSGGEGNTTNIETVNELTFNYFNVPLLMQYSLSKGNSPYFFGGLSFSFHQTPSFQSSGTETEEEYENGGVVSSSSESYQTSTKMDGLKMFEAGFMGGGGYRFKVMDQRYRIGLKVHWPITGSPLTTTDQKFQDEVFDNNEVFTPSGKKEAEEDGGFSFNDFRKTTVTLSISTRLKVFK